jgi:hypothetical protein
VQDAVNGGPHDLGVRALQADYTGGAIDPTDQQTRWLDLSPYKGLGDVTGDGLNDVLAAYDEDSRVILADGRIYGVAGPGEGELDPSSAFMSLHVEDELTSVDSLSAADLTGDGLSEVVLGYELEWIYDKVYIWQAEGDQVREDAIVLDLCARTFAGGDLDGDGTGNLVACKANGRMELWRLDGDTPTWLASLFLDGVSTVSNTGVDFDHDWTGDGQVDLWLNFGIGLNPGHAEVVGAWLLEGPWSGAVDLENEAATRITVDPTWGAVEGPPVLGDGIMSTGDVDGDGYRDIMIQLQWLEDPEGWHLLGISAFLYYGQPL